MQTPLMYWVGNKATVVISLKIPLSMGSSLSFVVDNTMNGHKKPLLDQIIQNKLEAM